MSADLLILGVDRLHTLRVLEGGQPHEEARVELGSFIHEARRDADRIADRERGSVSPDPQVIYLAERLSARALLAHAELMRLTKGVPDDIA